MRFIRNLNSGNSPLALGFPSLGTMNSERGFNRERRASCPTNVRGKAGRKWLWALASQPDEKPEVHPHHYVEVYL